MQEVNKAGEGVHVVLHLYKQGVPLCALINQYLTSLAAKFPSVKFLKAISTTCIPNYPDHNLPTIFHYFEGDMKSQLAGMYVSLNPRIDPAWLAWSSGATGPTGPNISTFELGLLFLV